MLNKGATTLNEGNRHEVGLQAGGLVRSADASLARPLQCWIHPPRDVLDSE